MHEFRDRSITPQKLLEFQQHFTVYHLTEVRSSTYLFLDQSAIISSVCYFETKLRLENQKNTEILHVRFFVC